MDAANLIKPPLARGELRCIGATTLDEYRRYVEKDPAFERRFQQVLVKEPSVEETISILRGLKEKYESHFGVRITDAALVQAAVLANRYITQRFLPDKAIDVLDEACSAIRVQLDSQPEIIDQLQRRKLQLEVEKTALEAELEAAKKGSSKTGGRNAQSEETDESDLGIDIAQNKERLRVVREELNALNDKLQPLLLRYDNEKERVEGLREYKKRLEKPAGQGGAGREGPGPGQGRRPALRRHPRPAEEDRAGGGVHQEGEGGAEGQGGEGRRHGRLAGREAAVRRCQPSGHRGDRLAMDRHPRSPPVTDRPHAAPPPRQGYPREGRRPGRGSGRHL